MCLKHSWTGEIDSESHVTWFVFESVGALWSVTERESLAVFKLRTSFTEQLCFHWQTAEICVSPEGNAYG